MTERRLLRPLAIVWLLGVSQILGYGTLYYSFSIVAADIAAEFAWPVAWVFGAFSLSLLAGGIVSPWTGRLVDRIGAAKVMALGSIAAAAALALAAVAPSPAIFVGALILIQLAATFVLYDSAFACLVQSVGADAGRRILHLTLIAGFASTLFWPLTSKLDTVLDWRQIFGLFALSHLVICLPIHLVLHRRTRRIEREKPAADDVSSTEPKPDRVLFLLTAFGFSVGGFTLSALLAQMVPLLATLGLGGSAVIVSALFGPSQVLIRLGSLLIGPGRHPLATTILASALMPAAVAVLASTAPLLAGAVVFAVLLGFGSGLKSIVQGTLPLALFGSANYGARLGWLASARLILAAVAPFAMAFLTEQFGARWALVVILAIGTAGLLPFLAIHRRVSARARSGGAHQPG